MKKLLIVYHSLTGGTRQMAEAAVQAILAPKVIGTNAGLSMGAF